MLTLQKPVQLQNLVLFGAIQDPRRQVSTPCIGSWRSRVYLRSEGRKSIPASSDIPCSNRLYGGYFLVSAKCEDAAGQAFQMNTVKFKVAG
jgi:hypothetical protein